MSNHGYGRTEIHERFDTGALDDDVLDGGVPAGLGAQHARRRRRTPSMTTACI